MNNNMQQGLKYNNNSFFYEKNIFNNIFNFFLKKSMKNKKQFKQKN